MKFNIEFSSLQEAVKRMGAPLKEFNISLEVTTPPQIAIDLGTTGIEVDLNDVDYATGMLSVEGHQILLYIQDHGGNAQKALEDGAEGKKYHVADCKTLQEMRERRRFDRYVATNKLDGEFYISGNNWRTKETIDGDTDLKVCKNCLKKLNYKGYQFGGKGWEVFNSFSLGEFFSTYSSFFKHHPKQVAGPSAINEYTDNWSIVRDEYKAGKNFTCEQCDVDLTDNRRLLHAHHVNGVKNDNASTNLRALCSDCHRKQDFHSHMYVPHGDMRQINELRRSQSGLNCDSWDEVFDLADPAVHGLLGVCRSTHKRQPEVGYEIQASNDSIVAELELAWPVKKIGIAISEDDVAAAKAEGWRIFTVNDALEKCAGNFV